MGKPLPESTLEPPRSLKTPNLLLPLPTAPRSSLLLGASSLCPRARPCPQNRVRGGGNTEQSGGKQPGSPLPKSSGFCFSEPVVCGLLALGWGGREGDTHRSQEPSSWRLQGEILWPGTDPAGSGLPLLTPTSPGYKLGWAGGCKAPAPSRRRRPSPPIPVPPSPRGRSAVPGSQMGRAGLTLQDVARRQSSCHFSKQC